MGCAQARLLPQGYSCKPHAKSVVVVVVVVVGCGVGLQNQSVLAHRNRISLFVIMADRESVLVCSTVPCTVHTYVLDGTYQLTYSAFPLDKLTGDPREWREGAGGRVGGGKEERKEGSACVRCRVCVRALRVGRDKRE